MNAMQTLTQRLANPTRFMSLSAGLLPWVSGLAAALIAIGLYMAFLTAPPDYQQGHTAKIMYVHVPSAWLSMFIYALVAASSFGLLVFRHPLADVSAKAAAPIGAVFTFLCLVTGSLWGKPMWGAFWAWDPRLTSVLILFFLYLGLIALRSSLDDEQLAGNLDGDPGHCRYRHFTGHQILRGLEQHPPAAERVSLGHADHPSFAPVASAGHDDGHDGLVSCLASQGHAQ